MSGISQDGLDKMIHVHPAMRIGAIRFVEVNKGRARILKHATEAEKLTFQGELSFQRSECTEGLTVATIFYVSSKETILC